MTAHQPGPVIDPLMMNDVAGRDAQRALNSCKQIGIEHPRPAQRRRGELEARTVATHFDQADAALLHDLARMARLSTRGEPDVAGAERRMARERQLGKRRKDAHVVVGRRIRGREQKGRLREIRPARKSGHLRFGKSRGILHDRQRVAAQRIGGKDVDLHEGAFYGHVLNL